MSAMRLSLMIALVALAVLPQAPAQRARISFQSTADGSRQPAWLTLPDDHGGERRPLLVLLHTWSGDLNQRHPELERAALDNRWMVLQPDFRGRNDHPEACGSDLAVQDIVDVVAWVRERHPVDERRVYLAGWSGGGHMALLMAGRHPQLWAAVSAWVPITDLARWHERHAAGKYGAMMRASCGGAPGASDTVDAEYRKRSPLTWLHQAKDVPLDIAAGIHDGHTGSVPVDHALQAFNLVAEARGDRPVSERDMAALARPDGRLQRITTTDREVDPSLGREIHLRRYTGPSRVTIFEGGHEGIATAAVSFLKEHARPAPRPQRPNILWLTCEDISPNLGCFGDPQAVTPNLDRLASEGVRYTRAFAPIGVCAPARSTIITGMYACSIGTNPMRSAGRLPKPVRCFTEHLREAGFYCTNKSKTDYNFQRPKSAWDASGGKAHWRNRPEGTPFFSVFNFTVCHESKIRAAEQQYQRLTRQLKPHERRDPAQVAIPPYHPDSPVVRRDWARYRELITAMDRQCGQILKQLEDDGLAEDTIVIYFSDHGAGLPRSKRWLYDSGTHVPMIVRFPERWKHLAPGAPGSATGRLVSFVDLAPTVLSLAGVEIPERFQGHAFLGEAAAEPRAYIHGFRDRMDERFDMIRCVRDQRYKLIRNFLPHVPYAQWIAYAEEMPTLKAWRRAHREGRLVGCQQLFFAPRKPVFELYDTWADPHEVRNLADDPQYATVKERLSTELRRWMNQIRDLGMLPEEEMRLRFDGPEYAAVRADPTTYPFDALWDAAGLIKEGADALPRLRANLAHEDAAIRWWAVTGIESLGDEGKPIAPQLLPLLKDPSVAVRLAAASALSRLGRTTAALPVIEAAMGHDHLRVRLRAVNLADRMDDAARPLTARLKELNRTDHRDIKKVTAKALRDLN